MGLAVLVAVDSNMDVANPEFLPDASMDQEEMLALQAAVRERARFSDDIAWSPDDTVVGVDLAFDGDDAVAAAVAIRAGEVVERSVVREPVAIPYIPGLLAFREAAPMITAITGLDSEWSLLLCDGNGRIHPREAGLATHVGVTLGCPAIGVAKSLLCGKLVDPPPEPWPTDTTVPIRDDADRPLGYAVQTRQWDQRTRSINPIYVSPGHRVSSEGAVDIVKGLTAGYKLPEPIRAADHLADETARER